ncbi:MAG: c-type cytochrome [Solirubrobacteraceae bacterium]
MSRLAKILAPAVAAVLVAAVTAACGTQKIDVPKDQTQVHRGAVIFNQRCAGCHSLSYAATYGSAPNIRSAQANSGPNFNQRCERPVDRVLYAIENGGFSGAYMPQNIVVGQDALDVAKFVATYAGRDAPSQVGITDCQDRPLGTLPSLSDSPTATAASVGTTPAAASGTKPAPGSGSGATGKKPTSGSGTTSTSHS